MYGFSAVFPMVFVLFPHPFIKQRTAFLTLVLVETLASFVVPMNAERKSVYVLKCHYNQRIEVSFCVGLYLYFGPVFFHFFVLYFFFKHIHLA